MRSIARVSSLVLVLVVAFLVAPPSALAASSISIADVTVVEGNVVTTTAAFTVSLSEVSLVDVTVVFATADVTAVTPDDYTAASGTLTIPAGSLSGVINVSVVGDTLDEPDETFFVNLANPVNAAILDGQAVGTITDDDVLPTACTIFGTSGSDTIIGTAGDDVICGLQGKDTIDGAGGNDTVVGNQGKDVLMGGDGDDVLIGGNGKDELTGGLGSDALFGGNAPDSLNSQDLVSANDSNDGGRGPDTCLLDVGDLAASCP